MEHKKKFAFYTHKGGVGKTSILTTIAIKAVLEGKHVAVIDCDPQLNSTSFLFRYGAPFHKGRGKILTFEDFYNSVDTYYDAISKDSTMKTEEDLRVIREYDVGHTNVWDVIREARPAIGIVQSYRNLTAGGNEIGALVNTSGPNKAGGNGSLRLIAGHPMLGEIEYSLAAEVQARREDWNYSVRFQLLADFLIEHYKLDMVFIDLSPSSSILNQNIIMSSDYLIMPCTGDEYAYYSIRSIGKWLATWRRRYTQFATTPRVLTVVFNKYKRQNHNKEDFSVKSGNVTIYTSKAHLDYIQRIQDDKEGAIKHLLGSATAYLVNGFDYYDFPLICEALSTFSKLSSVSRCCYDNIDYGFLRLTPTDHNTIAHLKMGFDLVWNKILLTIPGSVQVVIQPPVHIERPVNDPDDSGDDLKPPSQGKRVKKTE